MKNLLGGIWNYLDFFNVRYLNIIFVFLKYWEDKVWVGIKEEIFWGVGDYVINMFVEYLFIFMSNLN